MGRGVLGVLFKSFKPFITSRLTLDKTNNTERRRPQHLRVVYTKTT